MSQQGYQRRQRLAGEIRSVLAATLLESVKDPRLEGVTVSTVDLNGDMTRAVVYFSLIGDAERERQAADGFAAATSFLRRELGRRMRLRTLPDLVFSRDPSFEYGDRIERLFEELHRDGLMATSDDDGRNEQ
jgi:ribosome-binding factor A